MTGEQPASQPAQENKRAKHCVSANGRIEKVLKGDKGNGLLGFKTRPSRKKSILTLIRREHMTFGKPFEPGREKTGGRKLGIRNKLSERFLKDLHEEWERSGQDTLKILAKENPEAFARLAVGILPREFEGLPPPVQIITGVVRGDETIGEPSFQAPPAMLPPPKKPEPEAVACPLTTEDMVAPLPKATDITQPAKTEKLIYPKFVPRIGWR
jgi:hypothetical protein